MGPYSTAEDILGGFFSSHLAIRWKVRPCTWSMDLKGNPLMTGTPAYSLRLYCGIHGTRQYTALMLRITGSTRERVTGDLRDLWISGRPLTSRGKTTNAI